MHHTYNKHVPLHTHVKLHPQWSREGPGSKSPIRPGHADCDSALYLLAGLIHVPSHTVRLYAWLYRRRRAGTTDEALSGPPCCLTCPSNQVLIVLVGQAQCVWPVIWPVSPSRHQYHRHLPSLLTSTSPDARARPSCRSLMSPFVPTERPWAAATVTRSRRHGASVGLYVLLRRVQSLQPGQYIGTARGE